MAVTRGTSLEELHHLFVEGVERTVAKAQTLVEEEFPSKRTFLLAGCSEANKFDDAHGVLVKLWVSGAFPRIVDLAVCGVEANETVIWVCPSAHPLTSDLEQTWNQPPGAGPFKALGLMLPAHLWEKERPFRLADLRR